MRISSSQIYEQGVSSMMSSETAIAKTQQQLSSGQRIAVPADDPAGSQQLLSLSQIQEEVTQYQTNAGSAETNLQLEDSVLSNVSDALQRVRELVVGALNGTQSASDRHASALEIRQQLQSILALANSKNADGSYLFAGYYKGSSAAFVDNGAGTYSYNGDQGQKTVQIGRNRTVALSDNGDAVFMAVPYSGGSVQDMFTTLNGIADSLDANAPNSTSLDDIDSALNSVLQTRANVGARLNAISGQQTVNDSLLSQIEQTKSNVGDVDFVEATSRLNQQLVALQAAQQSFVKIEGLSLFNYL
jgi:flagellar hook-associated protein 3 FlgL